MPLVEHIGIYYSTLEGGGAPRVVKDQILYLLEAGYQVTFITQQDPDKTGVSHERLRIVRIEPAELEKNRGFILRNLNLRRRLRSLRLDVLVSHSVRHGTRVGFMSLMLPMRHIIVDHAHPLTTMSLLSRRQRYTLVWLLRGTRLLCVSQGAAKALSGLVGRSVGHVYNYAPDETLAAEFRNMPRAHTIVALGRFAQEKQFDMLIDAFERVSDSYPDWRLHLYGSGPEEKTLRRKAEESACPQRIAFFGWVDDPLRTLGEAGIMAQTSRYEGFGMAMVEAMAVGTPVVSFDCPFGPSEIIQDGKDGLLVTDQSVEAFSETLDRLMSAAELRQQLGKTATAVTDRFSKKAHVTAWLSEIEQMIGRKGP